MSFSVNLKKLRKENNLSQENLAEILEVSRQSVSKYEQGKSYPEIDKLIILSQRFGVSIDSLLGHQKNIADNSSKKNDKPISYSANKKIFIRNYEGTTMAAYYKFKISPVILRGKNEPSCVLSGVDKRTFWGEHSDILGWYASKEDATKEINAIQQAIINGVNTYELKHHAQVRHSLMKTTLDNQ